VHEHQFNTPEQVAGYLQDALDVVRQLELFDDLRPIAFAKAIELIAAKQVVVDAAQFAPPILTAPPLYTGGGQGGH
jgi:hypothetical protein